MKILAAIALIIGMLATPARANTMYLFNAFAGEKAVTGYFAFDIDTTGVSGIFGAANLDAVLTFQGRTAEPWGPGLVLTNGVVTGWLFYAQFGHCDPAPPVGGCNFYASTQYTELNEICRELGCGFIAVGTVGASSFSGPMPTPGPIVGVGLPGLAFAFGGLMLWWRRQGANAPAVLLPRP